MAFCKPEFTQVSSARGVAKQRASQFPACDIGIADGKTVPCIKTLGVDIRGVNSNSSLTRTTSLCLTDYVAQNMAAVAVIAPLRHGV